jgi:hypothetical protein
MSPKYKLDRAKNQVEHGLFKQNDKFFYDMWFDLDCGCAGNSRYLFGAAFENSRFFRVPTTVILFPLYYFVKVFFYISVVPLI